jgi:hypothetical protein
MDMMEEKTVSTQSLVFGPSAAAAWNSGADTPPTDQQSKSLKAAGFHTSGPLTAPPHITAKAKPNVDEVIHSARPRSFLSSFQNST